MASEEGISPSGVPLDGDTTDEELPQCKIKRNYACNLCSFFSQNPRSFLYHMRDVHFDKIKIYECSKCLYASKHSQKLQRHINMIHVSGRFSKKKETLRKPSRPAVTTDDATLLPPPPPAPPSASATEPKIKCSLCTFSSRSSAIISRHERVVHLKKRFLRCSKCSYVTHVKARFTKHVKYHSMPMIKCDLCDFRTPYKWNLDRHYKNHYGTGAFQCSKCNFRADIKQSLTVHEMNHHVPPVGAGAAILMRKRNKVGASESTAFESDNIDHDEMELLRLEREEEDQDQAAAVKDEESDDEEPDLNADPPVGKLETALSQPLKSEQGCFVQPDPKLKAVKCKLNNYRAVPYGQDVHEKRTRDKRPPPNLIPIQGKSSSPILRIPDVRAGKRQLEEPTIPPVNDEEFNEMCKKSSLTSSWKEIVSLIGDEDALKTIPDPSADNGDGCDDDNDNGVIGGKKQADLLNRKNASFFDKLKEKLSNEDEAKIGEATVKVKSEKTDLAAELSSTRCQHCRHRCKTSSDLVLHLKACKAFNAAYAANPLPDEEPDANRVFIWNELPRDEEIQSIDEDIDAEVIDTPPVELLEPETQIFSAGASSPAAASASAATGADPRALTLKKVFKCPHCSFWASTASRFHVHIVGHLNKKPFECSLCYYRSNWRWDITKHIRLKSARDPNHAHATVNMTDETGRRNYSKYNKFLTMMKVQEPLADSSGTGRRTRACDATQGTVQDGDILQPISDPAPTRLVSLPVTADASGPSVSNAQPSHLSSNICKRTLWKCKKCQYRNQDKEKVLAHVKSHYRKQALQAYDVDDEVDVGQPNDLRARNLFKCGHCSRISNWRQGILRHCRLKHNGDIKIIEVDKDENAVDDSSGDLASNSSAEEGLEEQPTAGNPFSCDVCPFIAEAAGDLTAHKLNHIDRPGSIFKCTYCPFFVPSKIAVLEHMDIHGQERNDNSKNVKIENITDEEIEEVKRFRCRHCPYVSNSRTQYLHHKQFHRPREAPFKCMFCSYNVSRRHLLHQHLKVHHMLREEDVPDIPLVWVLRAGTYSKMYKCRWCPHVNIRRSNIQDHEKMHVDSCKLQCPDCSYTCNNPGVLSSHVKVHSGYFGEIRSLVDPSQPDEEQIKTLQNERTAEPEITIQVDEENEPETPESSYYQTIDEVSKEEAVSNMMCFCSKCPARFFFDKELRIHCKFHLIRLPFKCPYCSYTARQRPHLLAHYKVHSMEYQERTARLVESYVISEENPRPKTGVIAPASDLILGPVWSVIVNETKPDKVEKKSQAKHSCTRCPAKFFKPVALQYHMTLHGGKHQHRCRYCDYTVKTYGNLIKHQLIHEQAEAATSSPQELKTDPQFGVLMHGSPDFIYPTYLKNGKVREKRYKCHKCPSAFEKRDQYRIHLSLHGAKQKYKCEKCDYSVKYYANYIQHMKKHQCNEEALQAKEQEKSTEPAEHQKVAEEFHQPAPLLQSEKQALLIMEKRRKLSVKDDDRKMFQCDLCPYVNMRRDCLENHERRHYFLSGVKYGFDCRHCDYTTTQANFLREHTRVHFKVMPLPEAYLLVENMTIDFEGDETMEGGTFFKDCGGGRFEPDIPDNDANDGDGPVEDKVLFDPVRWEPIDENDGDEVAAADQEEAPLPVKPKKRAREKNWRCQRCPHAFNKRDQYMRHVALHGSRQRYSCDICDYSVKFYTNYVQHMRMHQTHEPDRDIKIKLCVPGSTAVDQTSDAESDDVEAVDDEDDDEGDDDSDSDSSDVSSSSRNVLPAHLVEMSMVESEVDVPV